MTTTNLAAEDLAYIEDRIKSQLGEWLAEQSLGKPLVVYEIELHERMVRIEEELENQREVIKTILEQMDKHFGAVEKRFESMDKRMDRRCGFLFPLAFYPPRLLRRALRAAHARFRTGPPRSLAALRLSMSAQRAGRIGPFNTAESLLDLKEDFVNWLHTLTIENICPCQDQKIFPMYHSDGAVIDLLRNIYHTVDDVEFYVGLFAEDPDTSSPLPPLIRNMVAVDAFSQALINPLRLPGMDRHNHEYIQPERYFGTQC